MTSWSAAPKASSSTVMNGNTRHLSLRGDCCDGTRHSTCTWLPICLVPAPPSAPAQPAPRSLCPAFRIQSAPFAPNSRLPLRVRADERLPLVTHPSALPSQVQLVHEAGLLSHRRSLRLHCHAGRRRPPSRAADTSARARGRAGASLPLPPSSCDETLQRARARAPSSPATAGLLSLAPWRQRCAARPARRRCAGGGGG